VAETDLPRIEALRITEGCLVLLRDVELEPELMQGLIRGLAEIVGHTKFLILQVYEGADVEVVGPGNVESFLRSINLVSPEPEGASPDGNNEA